MMSPWWATLIWFAGVTAVLFGLAIYAATKMP
jgi:hypothetical protein